MPSLSSVFAQARCELSCRRRRRGSCTHVNVSGFLKRNGVGNTDNVDPGGSSGNAGVKLLVVSGYLLAILIRWCRWSVVLHDSSTGDRARRARMLLVGKCRTNVKCCKCAARESADKRLNMFLHARTVMQMLSMLSLICSDVMREFTFECCL